MKPADFYQGTADAMGVALYLYPDGSVTNSRKAGIEPTAMIEPHDPGCAETRAFNLLAESSSQFSQSENQNCRRRYPKKAI
jgi:hypothetical protein